MREQDFDLHVKVVAWLHVLESVLYIGGALLLVIFFSGMGIMADDPQAFGILSIVGLVAAGFLLLIGIPVALAGWGLLNRRPWSRVLAMVLAVLGLFLFPIGTIVGVYVLWVLTSLPAAAYFGEAPRERATRRRLRPFRLESERTHRGLRSLHGPSDRFQPAQDSLAFLYHDFEATHGLGGVVEYPGPDRPAEKSQNEVEHRQSQDRSKTEEGSHPADLVRYLFADPESSGCCQRENDPRDETKDPIDGGRDSSHRHHANAL